MNWILSKSVNVSAALGALLVLAGCETAPPAATQPIAVSSGSTTAPQVAPRVSPPQSSSSSTQIASISPSQSPFAPAMQEPQQQQAQATASAVSRSPAELALADGVDIYNQGNYPGAIKRLQEAKKIGADSVYIQQDADKYTAFAYCSIGRIQLCRQHFVLMLRKDSTYELSSAEASHPIWGATFKEAKASMMKKPPVKK